MLLPFLFPDSPQKSEAIFPTIKLSQLVHNSVNDYNFRKSIRALYEKGQ